MAAGVTITVGNGPYQGTNDDDRITGVATAGTGQIHLYGHHGSDIINMRFENINRFSHGHHVRGERGGTFSNNDKDIFNFQNLNQVKSTIIGRIDDFDYSRDEIQLEGKKLDLYNLPSNVRIVEYNGTFNDPGAYAQQWLWIKTSAGGHVFYALEGARVDVVNNYTQADVDKTPGIAFYGNKPNGAQEEHFISPNNMPDLNKLKVVRFVDQQNRVPEGYRPDGGVIINDGDRIREEAEAIVRGTDRGDLIAAGLNNDLVHAGSGNDQVWGGSGHDIVYGQNGNDIIRGGTGNDRIYGQSNNDTLYGQIGNDRLYGGDGNDRLYAHSGNDRLYGGDGNDYLRDESGRDYFDGGAGSDTVSYFGWNAAGKTLIVNLQTGKNNSADTYRNIENVMGSNFRPDHLTGTNGVNQLRGLNGNDTLIGLGGNDRLYAHSGNDRLYGGDGNDRLYAGTGNDRLYGGNGNDYLRDDAGRDYFDGGAGSDTVSYFGWNAAGKTLIVNLQTGKNNSADTYRNIENVMGSNFRPDHLTGSNGENTLYGKGGNDTLIGLGGDDLLYGGNHNDHLDGGAGDDLLSGGRGGDTFAFSDGFGRDKISDFRYTTVGEKIDLKNVSSIVDFADLQANHMTQSGRHTVIDAGNGDVLTIINNSMRNFDEDDFIFV